jgi:hypothetical protein
MAAAASSARRAVGSWKKDVQVLAATVASQLEFSAGLRTRDDTQQLMADDPVELQKKVS